MLARYNDPGGFRTHDLRIKSPLLYQLSYRVGSGNLAGSNARRDSEMRCRLDKSRAV